MPSHKIHNFIDRQLFGKSYWRLHRALDAPYIFMGKRHRVLLHDCFTSTLLARQLYPTDPRAEQAALVHCQLDTLCSSDPNFRKQLEILADLDGRQRRRAKAQRGTGMKGKNSSRKPKPADPLRDLGEFLKKIVEVKQLSKVLLG